MRASHSYSRRRKTPSLARSFGWSTLLACVGFSAAAGAQAITEADVVRLSQSAPELETARHAIRVAEAEEVKAGVYPNPRVGWQREAWFDSDAADGREDQVTLSLPIDISGRRGAERALARGAVEHARSGALEARSEQTVRTLSLFYAAVAAAERARIAEAGVERLEEAARVLARRQEAGTVSGYERIRVEVELELARSELRRARSAALVGRTELALLLGLNASTVKLRGGLVSQRPRETTDEVVRAANGKRSLGRLRASASATGSARESATTSMLPALSVTGGVRIGGPEKRYGYVAGIAVDLPLFAHGQEVRAETGAAHQLASARVRVADRETRLRVIRAHQELTAALDEIVLFDRGMNDRLARLERALSTGYREGERSVLEVVDAQRTQTEISLRRLALSFAAKLAELELRAAKGQFE